MALHTTLALAWLLGLLQPARVSCAVPAATPFPGRYDMRALELRATISGGTTCGYMDGEASHARTAGPGWDCRVDTLHGLWGFCPTTVIEASDCGLAAACKDSKSCTSICQFDDNNDGSSLTTFTCASSGTNVQYCSTALLTYGIDQTYGYLACGATATTQHYLVTTTGPSTSSTSSTSSSSPSSSSSSTTATSAPASSAVALSSSGTSSSATATPTSGGGGSSTNTGAIAGGTVGGVALVCLAAVAVVYILKRGRKANAADDTADVADVAGDAPKPSQPPPAELMTSEAHMIDSTEVKPHYATPTHSPYQQQQTVLAELPAQ